MTHVPQLHVCTAPRVAAVPLYLQIPVSQILEARDLLVHDSEASYCFHPPPPGSMDSTASQRTAAHIADCSRAVCVILGIFFTQLHHMV